jgi:site-specific DNA-methyltransferase (adenine-specific)
VSVTLHMGDCLDVMRGIEAGSISAVVTDPPWGIDADTDYTRFSGGLSDHRNFGEGIDGDAESFDPSPWLEFPKVALWGANCFSNRLPIGKWLVWLKKRSNQIGTFMSDAELCWVKYRKCPRRAPGVYLKEHIWHGFDRQSERGGTLHPTQKPVAVMQWCIEHLGLEPGSTILDPYMGSGTTGIAALRCGMNFIGIEQHEPYFRIAERRIAREAEQAKLFV